MSAARLATTGAPPHRAIADTVRLDLQVPPSANELFANVSGARRAAARAAGRFLPGRVKSEAYLRWINAAGWEVQAQKPGRIDGEYELEVAVGPTGADIGNLEKALSDLLQEHGVIANDRLASRIVIERSADMPAKRISVTLRPRWHA